MKRGGSGMLGGREEVMRMGEVVSWEEGEEEEEARSVHCPRRGRQVWWRREREGEDTD